VSTPLFRHGRGPLKQIVYNWRTRRQFRGVDAAISLSPAMTDDADKVLGRRITQCIRLPALDDEDAGRLRTQASGKMILAAGRLAEVKGFEVALRAFAHLADPDVRLVILGEGPRREGLAALATALGVADRVEFPGYVTDIRPWLEAARVFLLSSYYEGYAAVVVEALGAGRPVVSTNCTPAAFELLSKPEAGAVARSATPPPWLPACVRSWRRLRRTRSGWPRWSPDTGSVQFRPPIFGSSTPPRPGATGSRHRPGLSH
jgi:glycosyltransferase involved in cell wall biosynthesis